MDKINAPDGYDASAILQETKDKLDRPDKFAEIFCQAAKSQVKIKECLSKIIRELVTKDTSVNQHLNNTFKDIIKKDTKAFYTMLWKKLGWLLTVVGTIAVTLLTQFLAKKLGL